MQFTRRTGQLAAGVCGLALACPASAIITNGPASGNVVTVGWDSVGIISNNLGSASGVLIDPLHVLCAAHEVYGFSPSVVNFKFTVGGTPITASRIDIPSGYVGGNPTVVGNTTDYSTVDYADIAVVTLSSPVTGVTIYGYNHGQLNETSVAAATLVGMGDSGDGINGDAGTGTFGTKRLGTNTIDNVTTSPLTLTSGGKNYKLPTGVIQWDFDQVGAGNGPTGGAATGSSEGDAALGDSGGAIFQFDSNANSYVLTGVIDDGTNNTTYGEISWATQTAAYASFIATHTPEPVSMSSLFVGGLLLLRRRRK